jgi:FkbM family methyltransferase
LTQLHDGHYIYVDPQDLSMSAHIIAHGFWEKWVETAIRRMTRPGDYVVEIGANLGYHTLIMADCVGSSGKVQTFEANPRLCEHLARSIEFNGYAKRVSLTHAAVSDHSGMINFMVSRSSSGCGHIYMSGENHFADRQVLEVPAVTLDEVCDDRPVNLLRMDTEGSELLILAGASRMLERSPDIRICMEWDPIQTASRSDIQQGLAMMAAHGFRFWKLNTDRTLVETSPEAMRTLHGFEFIACRGSPLRP